MSKRCLRATARSHFNYRTPLSGRREHTGSKCVCVCVSASIVHVYTHACIHICHCCVMYAVCIYLPFLKRQQRAKCGKESKKEKVFARERVKRVKKCVCMCACVCVCVCVCGREGETERTTKKQKREKRKRGRRDRERLIEGNKGSSVVAEIHFCDVPCLTIRLKLWSKWEGSLKSFLYKSSAPQKNFWHDSQRGKCFCWGDIFRSNYWLRFRVTAQEVKRSSLNLKQQNATSQRKISRLLSLIPRSLNTSCQPEALGFCCCNSIINHDNWVKYIQLSSLCFHNTKCQSVLNWKLQ